LKQLVHLERWDPDTLYSQPCPVSEDDAIYSVFDKERYPDPVVVDRLVFPSDRHHSFGGELDGVRQQIQQDLLDPETVPNDAWWVGLEATDEADLEVLFLCSGCHRVESGLDHVPDPERLTLQCDRAVFETSNVEDIVDQAKQVFTARLDGLQVFPLDLRETWGFSQHSRQALYLSACIEHKSGSTYQYGRQRASKLMTALRQKLGLGRQGIAKLLCPFVDFVLETSREVLVQGD
jgi:hypothetical protein